MAADDRLRRVLDVAGALGLLAVSMPVLAGGALAVLLLSGRPVFYGHRRVGLGGRPFHCWKLRTMEVGAERALKADGEMRHHWVSNGYKVPGDPRRTRAGRWLRRTYVDELPQLFNVLNGTMSLVGPRPVVEDELHEFGDGADELLALRPGIFGAWNSRGPDRPAYPERARVELEYVRTRSLRRDAAILLSSVPVVLRGHHEDA
ncbi:MAG: sugar transferase [Gemmatimonadetes bacterium]|nr:sugar transferase [Gemmatimonadota bacterium]